MLTDLGSRLFAVLVSLMEWGELLKDDHKTGVELIHKDCGARLVAEIQCSQGHPVSLANTAVRIKDETSAKHVLPDGRAAS